MGNKDIEQNNDKFMYDDNKLTRTVIHGISDDLRKMLLTDDVLKIRKS